MESFSAEKIMKNKTNNKKLRSFLSVSESAFDGQLGKAWPSTPLDFVFSGRGAFI